jgi:phosphoribosylanthranilate isomerase
MADVFDKTPLGERFSDRALRRETGRPSPFAHRCCSQATARSPRSAKPPTQGRASPVARRTGAKVIKAVRVQSRATLQAAAAYHTDFLLLDAHVEGVPGGTGQTIDWELVRNANLGPPVLLSGGLNADNVSEAIAVTEPFAVDVASGTEASPGIKDPDKLQAFYDAVRGPSVAPAA